MAASAGGSFALSIMAARLAASSAVGLASKIVAACGGLMGAPGSTVAVFGAEDRAAPLLGIGLAVVVPAGGGSRGGGGVDSTVFFGGGIGVAVTLAPSRLATKPVRAPAAMPTAAPNGPASMVSSPPVSAPARVARSVALAASASSAALAAVAAKRGRRLRPIARTALAMAAPAAMRPALSRASMVAVVALCSLTTTASLVSGGNVLARAGAPPGQRRRTRRA